MEMSKFILILLLPLLAETLFAGDDCMAVGDAGVCIPLAQCRPLLNEIQSAKPMPAYIRIKLQSLTCGFESDEPLVCCVQRTNNPVTDKNFANWFPSGNMGSIPSDMGEVTEINGDVSPGISFNGIDEDADRRGGNDIAKSLGPPDISRHPNLRLLPENCGTIESDRIFGGNRTRLYEMPWMVLLSYDSGRGTRLSCGGTIISEWYVLTAAHCVSFLGSRLRLESVILGEYDVREDPDCERVEGQLLCAPSIRNVTIAETIPHTGYNPQTLFDDIALLRLSEPADFSLDNMKPVCLPVTQELQTESLEDKQGMVAGWGTTEDGLQSSVLLSVDLPIISNSACQKVYNGNPQITEKQLCAGGVKAKDSCGGDSGGPIMYPGQKEGFGVRYVQRGVVSFGSKRCGLGGYPGVYTRIAYYMDWILDHMHE